MMMLNVHSRGEWLSLTCSCGRCRVLFACVGADKQNPTAIKVLQIVRFSPLYSLNQKKGDLFCCVYSKLSRLFGQGNYSRDFQNLPWFYLILGIRNGILVLYPNKHNIYR